MPEKLTLRVVTPDRLVLEEQVDEVVLPGHRGSLGILPEHTPLLTRVGIGECDYRQGREHSFLAIAGGFAEIGPEHVTILADQAHLASEIDTETARREVAEAKALFDQSALEEQDAARDVLEAAQARLRVAQMKI